MAAFGDVTGDPDGGVRGLPGRSGGEGPCEDPEVRHVVGRVCAEVRQAARGRVPVAEPGGEGAQRGFGSPVTRQ
jgi:hypothetical protein